MTYILSLKKENRNLHKRLNDKHYQTKKSLIEDIQSEKKYFGNIQNNINKNAEIHIQQNTSRFSETLNKIEQK